MMERKCDDCICPLCEYFRDENECLEGDTCTNCTTTEITDDCPWFTGEV